MRAGLALAVVVLAAVPAAAAPKVTARAAIIVDAQTGKVIWSRNADLRLPPASTTKVMTAIVAAESGELDRRVPVSSYAAGTAPSKIWLRPGQSMAVRDLLYAVLLKSANDAAVVLAEGVAGSVPAFSRRMNAKARAIGATRSSFSNPHGLTQQGHVSTARDLAAIFRYAIRKPLLREVLTTKSIRVPIYSKGVRTIAVHSHNRLLTGYEHPVIGKTGYTRAARRCFVGAARGADGREVVVALLGSNSLWPDARALVEYGLDALEAEKPSPQVQMVRLEEARQPPGAEGDAPDDSELLADERAAPRSDRRYSDTVVLSPEPTRRAPAPRLVETGRAYAAPAPRPIETAGAYAAPAPRPAEPAPVRPYAEPAPPARPSERVPPLAAQAPRREAPMPIRLGDSAPAPRARQAKPAARPEVELAMLDETPAEAAESAGSRRWAVELGPFETRLRAESTRRGLADLGYGSRVSGRTIRLGSFSNRSRADRLADRLRLSGYRPTIVALR